MKYGKVVKGELVEAPAGAGPSEGWLPVAKRPAPPGAEQAGWRVQSGWVVPAWRKRSIPELPEDPTNAEVMSTVRKLAAAAGCLLLSLMLPAATVHTARNSELRQSSSVVTNVTFEGLLTQHQDISGKADKSYVDGLFEHAMYVETTNSVSVMADYFGVWMFRVWDGAKYWWIHIPNKDGTMALTGDIPTKVSDLQNDSGFITSSSLPTKTSDLTNDSGFITSSSLPTKTTDLTNDSGFITQASVPAKVSQLQNDSGFITQASVPTKVSQLQNDSGFATSTAVAEAVAGARADFETKVVHAVITNRTYNLIPDHQLGVVWKNTAENGRFFARCYTNDLSVVEGP